MNIIKYIRKMQSTKNCNNLLKNIIGEEKFNNIPKLDRNLLNRTHNCNSYTMFVLEDFDINQKVGILEVDDFIFFLVIKENGKLFSYRFMNNIISTCRHGRPLYQGPYTEIICHFTELKNKQMPIVFLPLTNFLFRP